MSCVDDIREKSIKNIYTLIWYYIWFYCIFIKELNGRSSLIIFLFIIVMDKIQNVWGKIIKTQK